MKERLKILVNFNDKAGEFYRNTFYDSFRYCSFRVPEVADEIYKIDQAIKACKFYFPTHSLKLFS